MQEHNKKYNELFTQKLNGEEVEKSRVEKEKKLVIKEWNVKHNDAIRQARE